MGGTYRIKLKGHLDLEWSAWIENLVITHHEDGTTELLGPVRDQAALHGLLCRIRDLGLPLLSLNLVGQQEET